MQPYSNEFQIPPFEEIQIADYEPAFDAGIAEANASIDSIVSNPEAPTFANTILALDNVSPTLERVMSVLMSLTEANSTAELQEVSEKLLPRYSTFSDEMMMNAGLFDRVKYLYDRKDSLGLAHDEMRALEQTYKDFVRNGALLDDDNKKALKEVNSRLSNLYIKFNKNLLAANNAFEIVVDNEADLAGIPANIVEKPRPRHAEKRVNGCSPSMPPAVCPCCSMPTTATCAKRCGKATPAMPRAATRTTVP